MKLAETVRDEIGKVRTELATNVDRLDALNSLALLVSRAEAKTGADIEDVDDLEETIGADPVESARYQLLVTRAQPPQPPQLTERTNHP